MVIRRSDRPLEMITIRIYQGDRGRLKRLYPSLGHNRAIREIVHKHLNQTEAKINEAGEAGELEIEIAPGP